MNEDIDINPLNKAKKFIGLMESFELDNAQEMEDTLVQHQELIVEEIKKESEVEIPEDLEVSIIETSELLKDFVLIRETLRDDIKNTKTVLEKMSKDMSYEDTNDMNGQVLMAFSDLKKSNVKSMELLISSYEKVAKTQLEVKKLTAEIKSKEIEELNENGDTNIKNAIFVGSPKELLEGLLNNN